MSKRSQLSLLPLAVLCSSALATPELPQASVAAQAVKQALAQPAPVNPVKPAPQVSAVKPSAAKLSAEQARQQSIAQALQQSSRGGASAVVRATAYNSFAGQTDSSPTITATGTRTRPGVIALSQDLLRRFPYGTRVRIEDLSGRLNFGNRVFIVEDTMHPRKRATIDIWMGSHRQAMQWGARSVRITAIN